MTMEFKILNITEKFRTLEMQGQTVPPEVREEAYNLEKDWK